MESTTSAPRVIRTAACQLSVASDFAAAEAPATSRELFSNLLHSPRVWCCLHRPPGRPALALERRPLASFGGGRRRGAGSVWLAGHHRCIDAFPGQRCNLSYVLIKHNRASFFFFFSLLYSPWYWLHHLGGDAAVAAMSLGGVHRGDAARHWHDGCWMHPAGIRGRFVVWCGSRA